MKRIKIELLSDLCVSSGFVYNSSIDNDCCYDEYGLPYIPAKRLKGCLREVAQEINDWTGAKTIDIDKLFGKADGRPGALTLSNARLDDYRGCIQMLQKENRSELTHQQTVLSMYTYIRTQTAIDYGKGSALEGALRRTRVVKQSDEKGALVFFAEFDLKDKELTDQLIMCCRGLKEIGLNRSRGFGSVNVTVKTKRGWNDSQGINHGGGEGSCDNISDDAMCRLNYRLKLNSPVLFKSNLVNQSENYIEGAKIIGYIATQLKKEQTNDDFLSLMDDGEIKCSNAYISDGTSRYLPVSAQFFTRKGIPEELINLALSENKEVKDGEMLSMAKELFLSPSPSNHKQKTFNQKTVKMEIHYHHTRPADKAIGHAVKSEDESNFYQVESVSSNQLFQGFIEGKGKQIKEIIELINQSPRFRMGHNRGSEYGEVEISLIDVEHPHVDEAVESVSEFLVKLEAPLILYNDQCVVSTDKKVVEAALQSKFGAELTINRQFVKEKMLSGYNVTWNLAKPTIQVLDKGSVFIVKMDEKNDKLPVTRGWLGERNSEGYGEISVLTNLGEPMYILENQLNQSGEERPLTEKELSQGDNLKQALLKHLLMNKLTEEATTKIIDGQGELANLSTERSWNAVVQTLVSIQRENDNYQSFITEGIKRYSPKNEKDEKDKEDSTSEDKRNKQLKKTKLLIGSEADFEGLLTRLVADLFVSDKEDNNAKDKLFNDLLGDSKVYHRYYKTLLKQATIACQGYAKTNRTTGGEEE